jgi:UDP-N-acetylglucosamine 2-epimerase (non-hydrolysing)
VHAFQHSIICLVGTRPECIKMAPVITALRAQKLYNVRVISTGQHKELVEQTLGIFGIAPDVDLAVMVANQSLAGLSARILDRLDPLLVSEKPALVLAQGDTTSVMMAALACFFRQIPFGHVEAGLRTGDLKNPFPEEMNRVVAGLTADIHFAPTESSRQNLLAERISPDKILVTGNTVIDALKSMTTKPLPCAYPKDPNKRLVLVTAHRRENFGAPFQRICEALRQLHDRLTDAEFVYPVHPNPNVRSTVMPALAGLPRMHLIDPVDYLTMAGLMQRAHLIVTDSGGIQEEAPALGKPVLVLRNETERPEAVEAGVARLLGTETNAIVDEVYRVWNDEKLYRSMARGISPYGDGLAAGRIAEACRDLITRRHAGAPNDK